jgi:acyl carrier protein
MNSFPRTIKEVLARIDSQGNSRPRPPLPTTFVPPRDLWEQEVAACWSEVLRIDRIGVNDDFFELGGDSLRMTQIISRIQERFSLELSFGDFFDNLTVAELAASLRGRPKHLEAAL